jgi:hypothetical protein
MRAGDKFIALTHGERGLIDTVFDAAVAANCGRPAHRPEGAFGIRLEANGDGGFSTNQRTYGTGQWDDYDRLDARTQMEQILARIRATNQTQSMDIFSPECPGIVAVVDRNEGLSLQISATARDLGYARHDYINIPLADTICIQPNRIEGWNGDVSREWYSQQPEYRNHPYVDAASRIADILMWMEIHSNIEPPRRCAIVVPTPEINRKVQEMAFGCGFGWNGSRSFENTEREVLWIGYGLQSKDITYSDLRYAEEEHTRSGDKIYNATTQWPLIERFFNQFKSTQTTMTAPPAEHKDDAPKTCIVVSIHSQVAAREVEQLALAAGYTWSGQPRGWLFTSDIRRYMSLGAYPGRGRQEITHDSYRETFLLSAINYSTSDTTSFNALRAHLKTIREWAEKHSSEAPKKKAAALLSPSLFQLIQHSPGASMVRGFVRRDMKMKLPEDVQAKGADAIFKWIEDNQKPELIWPEDKESAGVKVAFKLIQTVSFTGNRTDVVTVQAEVPATIVRQARQTGDTDVIVDYLGVDLSWDNLLELEREEGNGGGGNIVDREWDGFFDRDALRQLARDLMR